MMVHEPIDPGLCGTCRHAKRTLTKRGSVFYRCGLAQTNPAFQKYPALPVRRCRGYEPGETETAPETRSRPGSEDC